jgi:hypothetical protein
MEAIPHPDTTHLAPAVRVQKESGAKEAAAAAGALMKRG